jgi:hypothetical protein
MRNILLLDDYHLKGFSVGQKCKPKRKKFSLREFRVTREGGMNCLVNPYYEEGGGTVIDWVPPDEGD